MLAKLFICADHVCSSDCQTGIFSRKIYLSGFKWNSRCSSDLSITSFTGGFMGNPQTLANITARVYVSVTLVGILSAGTSWNKLTGSMRTFRIPSLFIFTLDITLKYISVLGEICIDILTSVGLRSVGKNHEKTKAFSGVLGITFLKSSEMAEEMYASMCCRGFTGEYSIGQKYKIRVTDIFYILVTVGCVGLFFYLNRGM